MGKATGFMEYGRQDKTAEEPEVRIRHFREFHTPLSREEQERQGARCMACGVPFCQAGQVLCGAGSRPEAEGILKKGMERCKPGLKCDGRKYAELE